MTSVMWSMDDWKYVERQIVADPKGRRWTVGLMDVLGQDGDPDMPNDLLQMQYAQGRYFTLVWAPGGGIQWERGYASLPEATTAYERLVLALMDGRVDPSQPTFRADLDDD